MDLIINLPCIFHNISVADLMTSTPQKRLRNRMKPIPPQAPISLMAVPPTLVVDTFNKKFAPLFTSSSADANRFKQLMEMAKNVDPSELTSLMSIYDKSITHPRLKPEINETKPYIILELVKEYSQSARTAQLNMLNMVNSADRLNEVISYTPFHTKIAKLYLSLKPNLTLIQFADLFVTHWEKDEEDEKKEEGNMLMGITYYVRNKEIKLMNKYIDDPKQKPAPAPAPAKPTERISDIAPVRKEEWKEKKEDQLRQKREMDNKQEDARRKIRASFGGLARGFANELRAIEEVTETLPEVRAKLIATAQAEIVRTVDAIIEVDPEAQTIIENARIATILQHTSKQIGNYAIVAEAHLQHQLTGKPHCTLTPFNPPLIVACYTSQNERDKAFQIIKRKYPNEIISTEEGDELRPTQRVIRAGCIYTTDINSANNMLIEIAPNTTVYNLRPSSKANTFLFSVIYISTLLRIIERGNEKYKTDRNIFMISYADASHCQLHIFLPKGHAGYENDIRNACTRSKRHANDLIENISVVTKKNSSFCFVLAYTQQDALDLTNVKVEWSTIHKQHGTLTKKEFKKK